MGCLVGPFFVILLCLVQRVRIDLWGTSLCIKSIETQHKRCKDDDSYVLDASTQYVCGER